MSSTSRVTGAPLPRAPRHADDLAAVAALDAEVARTEGARLAAVARWAVAETRRGDDEADELGLHALPGQERLVRPGGAGSPLVGEFLVCELQARLALSPYAASALLADALSLVHRLPGCLALLAEAVVPAWRARLVATATRELPRAVAEELDLRLSTPYRRGARPLLATISRARLLAMVEQSAVVDSPDQQGADGPLDRRLDALDRRHVTIMPSLDGVAEVHGTLSTADAERLGRALDDTAAALADAGDDRPLELLRSVALGRIADRLVGAEGVPPAPTTLYVHLDHATRTWCTERGTPLSAPEVTELVASSAVTVTPVIDLADDVATTGYVTTPRQRLHTSLRQHGRCSFPYCTRQVSVRARRRALSRARRGGTDADHVVPWAAGGPTSTANLQLLCRFHHRAKTHGRWTATASTSGDVTWVSPAGCTYRVAGGTTTPLRI